ncbi:MAG: cytochrome c oxidase subunit II [Dehalococcoidia bacterium]
MSRHVISAVLLWAFLTGVGEATILLNWFPSVGSHEAEDFDQIFRILLAMGFPVFTFVIAVLVYSILEFRTRGPEDAPARFLAGSIGPGTWLVLTSLLAFTVMIFPGLTGLGALTKERTGNGWGDYDAQLVIHATGYQWSWKFEYPQSGIQIQGSQNELVLPVNTVIRFDVDSADVVHSLWVPAFRMKIDAIPGRTTFMTVKPTELGHYDADAAFRVQCAELCGLDHSGMFSPIRVVTVEDFRDWVDSQTAATAKGQ